MPALLAFLALVVSGAGLTIAGTYVLAGLGASLLVAGALVFAFAGLLRVGMRANG